MPGSEEDRWAKLDRITLENYAAGRPRDAPNLGRARVELLRRDNEYAEEQERSRRKFETDHQAARQEFEEKLAQRQMDHAAELADRQLSAATSVANATRWAVWAAGFSAGGAVITAIVEVIRLALGK
jgi:hypothetical protein